MKIYKSFFTGTFFIATVLILFQNLPSYPQNANPSNEPVKLEYGFNGKYSYTERTNLSKYINGKYTGLTHRETKANMKYSGENSEGSVFSGFFYVTEETLRDMKNVSLPLDEIIPTEFAVSNNGNLSFVEDNGYPRMRNFPAFPEEEVKPGDYWEAEALRIIDPKNTGKTTEMPVYVAYTFSGTEEYRGRPVHRIKAKYATRIGRYNSVRSMDPELKEAQGTHDVDILVDAETGLVTMILDRMDETFFYTDGGSIRLRGSSAAFTEQAVMTEKGVLPREITRIADAAQSSAEKAGLSMPESVDDSFGDTGTESAGEATAGDSSPAPGTGGKGGGILPWRPDSGATGKKDGGSSGKGGAGGNSGKIEEPFTVDVTDQGIKLSVRDIRFKPDSSEILPEEKWRIDAIAETLKLAEGMNFLVEGHTASVGKPAGEKELSIQRAKKITDELAARGIPAERFVYTGYGGTKPVADNSTAEGRAQNRRVEITILGAE